MQHEDLVETEDVAIITIDFCVLTVHCKNLTDSLSETGPNMDFNEFRG